MPMLADQVGAVIGVDTHHDTHTASIVTPLGAELAHPQAPADAAGYRALLDFARFHAPGTRIVWALEGTRSHGTGPTRALQACGGRVVEVDRPKRPVRKHGKSDPIDATRAARDALTRVRLAEPRADGAREELLAGVLRAGHPPPPQPRQGPAAQSGPARRRDPPTPLRPPHPRLRRPPTSRRQHRPRDPPLPHWMSMGGQVRLACSSGTAGDGLDVSPPDGLFAHDERGLPRSSSTVPPAHCDVPAFRRR